MTRVAPKPEAINILLVEDDDGDAMAVERAFRRARIANPIVRVCDGIEALELLRSRDPSGLSTPFIVLADINMPRMTGHELVQEIRASPDLRRLVVFMLSTSRDRGDIETAYDGNVAGYIVKDEAGEDFLKLTEGLGGFWRLVELP